MRFEEKADDLSTLVVVSLLSGTPIEFKYDKINRTRLPKTHNDILKFVKLISPNSVYEAKLHDNSEFILKFDPGQLEGGKLEFHANSNICLSILIRIMFQICIFCKNPTSIRLFGRIASKNSPSVDFMRLSTLPFVSEFLELDPNDIVLKIIRKSITDNPAGEVLVKIPIVSKIKAKQLEEIGLIKKIRGISWSLNIPPEISLRSIKSFKDVICKHSTNVHIATNFSRDTISKSNPNPGQAFSLIVYAESENSKRICAEKIFVSFDNKAEFDPEELGKVSAYELLHKIYTRSYIDEFNSSIALVYMALSENHVSIISLPQLCLEGKYLLRYLNMFFNQKFSLKTTQPCDESNVQQYKLSCLGNGFVNYNRILY
ncbi:MAG: rRNA-processing endoribonuclease [Marteilia pararefringens]